jgi:hypothetical protein
MLELRSADPHRAAADRRVAIVGAYGALGVLTLVAVLAGAGLAAVWVGGTLALAGLPWLLAFNGRPYLLDDALNGVPFAWRGERTGVWAFAPPSGALLGLLLVAALHLGTFLGLLVCLGGAALHTWLLFLAERAHERRSYLDLAVLELRFEAITDARPRRTAAVKAQAEVAKRAAAAKADPLVSKAAAARNATLAAARGALAAARGTVAAARGTAAADADADTRPADPQSTPDY